VRHRTGMQEREEPSLLSRKKILLAASMLISLVELRVTHDVASATRRRRRMLRCTASHSVHASDSPWASCRISAGAAAPRNANHRSEESHGVFAREWRTRRRGLPQRHTVRRRATRSQRPGPTPHSESCISSEFIGPLRRYALALLTTLGVSGRRQGRAVRCAREFRPIHRPLSPLSASSCEGQARGECQPPEQRRPSAPRSNLAAHGDSCRFEPKGPVQGARG